LSWSAPRRSDIALSLQHYPSNRTSRREKCGAAKVHMRDFEDKDVSSRSRQKHKVALVGTGTMGFPIAQRLLKAGYCLSVCNRSPAKALPLRQFGARVTQTATDAVHEADCLMLLLPDGNAVQSILDELRVTEQLRGKTVIQMGLLTRQEARYLERAAKEVGGEYVNASLCGSKLEAANGNLFIAVGGSRSLFEKYHPLLQVLGTARYVGETTASATVALATMQLSFALISSFCLAVGMFERAQIPAGVLLDALKDIELFHNAEHFARRAYLDRVQESGSRRPLFPGFFSPQELHRTFRAIIDATESMGLNNQVFRAVGQHLIERIAQPDFNIFAAEFGAYLSTARRDEAADESGSHTSSSVISLILSQL